MPAGGRITITTELREIGPADTHRADVPADGAYVVVRVADTGSGIAPEVRARIFEPFFTTKDRAGNSGLGLATVIGVVAASGGGVHVQSAEGRGSTFSVFLPRSSKTPAALPRPAPRREAPRAQRATSILLVDDNPDVRQATNDMLELAGYSVTAVASPAAALEALERSRFDLLVTDIVLPEMSGRRLAERVVAAQPATRVLFITGHAEALPPERAQPGRLLRKPFSMEDLLEAIDGVAGPAGGPSGS
jgi:CheY-like chemotaxis protein